jgi:hypothetical protein
VILIKKLSFLKNDEKITLLCERVVYTYAIFDENLLLKCASMFYIIIFVVMSQILLAMKNKNGTCKKIKGLRSLM